MRLRSHPVAAILSLFALAAPAIAAAQSQPYETIEAPATWRIDIGGGVTYGFSATGNTDSDYNLTPWGSANYRNIAYANGLDGLGWNIVSRDAFRAGVQVRPRFSAGEIEGSTLERPGLGADGVVYAYGRLPGNVVVGGRIGHDVTDDDAGLTWHVSAGHQRVTPVGLLQTSAYVRGGDSDRAQAYFGVSPDEAPGSGYPAFTPGGGAEAAGAALFLAIPIGQRFGLGGFVNYEQRLGDIRDSPLTKDDHVWRAGLIGVMRFRSAD